jgi:hypothetical protein
LPPRLARQTVRWCLLTHWCTEYCRIISRQNRNLNLDCPAGGACTAGRVQIMFDGTTRRFSKLQAPPPPPPPPPPPTHQKVQLTNNQSRPYTFTFEYVYPSDSRKNPYDVYLLADGKYQHLDSGRNIVNGSKHKFRIHPQGKDKVAISDGTRFCYNLSASRNEKMYCWGSRITNNPNSSEIYNLKLIS